MGDEGEKDQRKTSTQQKQKLTQSLVFQAMKVVKSVVVPTNFQISKKGGEGVGLTHFLDWKDRRNESKQMQTTLRHTNKRERKKEKEKYFVSLFFHFFDLFFGKVRNSSEDLKRLREIQERDSKGR